MVETMWRNNRRDQIWSSLDKPFDLIVIGGGITGAGVFLEATRAGLNTLLIDAHDFASGTSSRSSKLVHGGFRYLKNAQIKVTFDSVRERERLLRDGRGLINQISFLFPGYKGDRIPTWALGLGLTFYDLLALRWGHKYYPAKDLLELCPQLNTLGLRGGYRYFDALTDDARLVLRVILEGIRQGGIALNYSKVESILRSSSGMTSGIILRDMAPEGNSRMVEVNSKIVINAAGAWADHVRSLSIDPTKQKKEEAQFLRRLRGSHLVFPTNKLPLIRAVSIWHPIDRRPVFAFPWEGVTIVGTTDVDHAHEMNTDPSISTYEAQYLLEAVRFSFPTLELQLDDVQATFSGIRAVIDTGKSDPSKESREHTVLHDDGLLTITGGKLTTFRLMAREALKFLCKRFFDLKLSDPRTPVLTPLNWELTSATNFDKRTIIRLIGRYGTEVESLLEIAAAGESDFIASTPNIWAELCWAARTEGIVHLDDLLLRRVRLGILLPCGGQSVIDRIKVIVQRELNWSDERWQEESENYFRLLEKSYSVKSLPLN
jgi:glycerol-3-phosphate dehydrogenase